MESNITKSNIDYILDNYNKVPLNEIATNVGCKIVEVTSILRKNGLLNEVQPEEINYILMYKDGKMLSDIQKELYMSNSQFSQICRRYGIGKKSKSREEFSEKEIIKITKNILEEKLQLQINDTLASTITNKEFLNANAYALINYAEKEKKKDPTYRYFSAVAYLFHLAYPNRFKPYQFMHSAKTIEYFTTKRYLGELVWVMEEKMNFNMEYITILAKNNKFLRKNDLEFYGLGSNLYIKLFGSKKEMIRQLMLHLKVDESRPFKRTEILKRILKNDGIETNKCFCNGCKNTQIQIHHIVGKKYANMVSFNVDESFNLIPLCSEHHIKANNMDISTLNISNRSQWRNITKKYLEEE